MAPGKVRVLKVILLGDGGVGKSSIMNRFVHDKFDAQCYHTIGVEFVNKEVEIDKEKYTLQLWDTAGQERFRTLRTPFYRGSDICVLTFSVDDPQSFKALETWRKEFFYYSEVEEHETFPFIIVGNKCDLTGEERLVSTETARSWCREHNDIVYVETSAKSNINITSAFQAAVRQWLALETHRDRRNRDFGDSIVQLQASPRFRGNGSISSNSGSSIGRRAKDCCSSG